MYVGMLVRGAGETFNLIVPVRRMKEWAKARNASWALDDSKVTPSIEEVSSLEPEDAALDHKSVTTALESRLFPHLIITNKSEKINAQK